MALLHRLRDRGRGLTRLRRRPFPARRLAPWGAALAWIGGTWLAGCARESDLSLRPDSVLRAELGLTDADRVHRINLTGGSVEALSRDSLEIQEGDWVEFVSGDWWVHEVRFQVEGLVDGGRAFLEGSDQVASPPMVQPDDRFVVSFLGAPEGLYPFLVEGNGAPAGGVVVVVPRR